MFSKKSPSVDAMTPSLVSASLATTSVLMEQQKNLHASIPAALPSEAEQAANDDHISADDLVREALERSAIERRREEVFAYGKQQARKLGVTEEDVERIVHEFREENRSAAERGHLTVCSVTADTNIYISGLLSGGAPECSRHSFEPSSARCTVELELP
jgi:hypothetical protein